MTKRSLESCNCRNDKILLKHRDKIGSTKVIFRYLTYVENCKPEKSEPVQNKKFIKFLFCTSYVTSLIGPRDIKFHYFDLLKIPEDKFYKQLTKLQKHLERQG
jgi:hypothetical protein